jgi:hypothetical protein
MTNVPADGRRNAISYVAMLLVLAPGGDRG